jgi:hypothetical protein
MVPSVTTHLPATSTGVAPSRLGDTRNPCVAQRRVTDQFLKNGLQDFNIVAFEEPRFVLALAAFVDDERRAGLVQDHARYFDPPPEATPFASE